VVKACPVIAAEAAIQEGQGLGRPSIAILAGTKEPAWIPAFACMTTRGASGRKPALGRLITPTSALALRGWKAPTTG